MPKVEATGSGIDRAEPKTRRRGLKLPAAVLGAGQCGHKDSGHGIRAAWSRNGIFDKKESSQEME